MESCEILISGGGVAGLTAAAVFGAAGLGTVVVDPAPPVTEAGAEGADLRSTALLQPARDLLAETGLWDRLGPHATPLRVMRIVDAGGDGGRAPVMRDFLASDIGQACFGWNIPNWLIRREIVARLAEMPNVRFLPGTGFSGYLARDDAARVRLSDGRVMEARLVVAADGRDSLARQAAGIGVRTMRYGQKALVFAVSHARPHDGVSTEVHRAGGPFTLVPLPDHEGRPCSAVVWMETGPEVIRLAGLPAGAFSAAATERSAEVTGELRLVARRQVWPIISQIADRITGGRMALVAEAAHVVPPIGAQGLNMSLRDIAVLRDLALADPAGLGGAAMLDAYARARHGDLRLRVTGIDMLNRISMSGMPGLRDLRATGLRLLHDVAPLRRGLMRLGLGVGRDEG